MMICWRSDDSPNQPPNSDVPMVSQEDKGNIPLINDINHHFNSLAKDKDDDLFRGIVGHEWRSGQLFLNLEYVTDETEFQPFSQLSIFEI